MVWTKCKKDRLLGVYRKTLGGKMAAERDRSKEAGLDMMKQKHQNTVLGMKVELDTRMGKMMLGEGRERRPGNG